MTEHLARDIEKLFTNEFISAAALYSNENEAYISRSIQAILPTILGSFASKATARDGANLVIKMLEEQHKSGLIDNGEICFRNDQGILLNKGAAMVRKLFGNQADNISIYISGFAGARLSTVSTLLSVSVTLVLSFICNKTKGADLNAEYIHFIFDTNKNEIIASIPKGYSPGNILRGIWDNNNQISNTTIQKNNSLMESKAQEKVHGGLHWLLVFILLFLAAILAWGFK